MNNKQIQEILDGVLKSKDLEAEIVKLVSLVDSVKQDILKEVMNFIKQVLFSRHYSPLTKIRILKLLQALVNSENEFIVYVTGKKIIAKIPRVLDIQESVFGYDLWAFLVQSHDQSFFEFFVLALQCIENWAELFTTDAKGKPSRFYEVYQDLKSKDVEFPPEFLFQTLSQPFQKRDLQRSRRLSKELKASLSTKTKKKATFLNSLCEVYQRQIELKIEESTKKNGKVSDDLVWTYSELSESMSLYQAWKANGYQLKDKNLTVEICKQLDDIYPKSPPSPDSLSDSLEKLEIHDSLILTEREEKDTMLRDDEITSAEYYKLKEKLIDTEELVSMYKADIANLQSKFLDATEKKEELKYRINAILFSNREINKLLTEANKKLEELESANFNLTEDVDAFRSQNESLKISIREIQETCIKYEKEREKQKNYIENLENRNHALMDSNQTLKIELDRLRPLIKDNILAPSIYMNPKHGGDSENSYHLSQSESSLSRSQLSIDEEKI